MNGRSNDSKTGVVVDVEIEGSETRFEDTSELVFRAVLSEKLVNAIRRNKFSIIAVLGSLVLVSMCDSGVDSGIKAHAKIVGYDAGYDAGKKNTLAAVSHCLADMPEDPTACVKKVEKMPDANQGLLNDLKKAFE